MGSCRNRYTRSRIQRVSLYFSNFTSDICLCQTGLQPRLAPLSVVTRAPMHTIKVKNMKTVSAVAAAHLDFKCALSYQQFERVPRSSYSQPPLSRTF